MFKFDLGQRVNVPHFIGVQGIVTSRADGISVENRYNLDWLTDLTRSSGGFSESEMLLANGEPLPKTAKLATVKINVDSSDLDRAIKKTRALARLVKSKRKPARKSKPKRKR